MNVFVSFGEKKETNRTRRMDLVLTFHEPFISKEEIPTEERHASASDSSESSTEGSSEYETDTSAEEPEATRIRPMFVSKSQRKTELSVEVDEELVAEKRRKEAEERRKETQEMISRQLEEERRSREEARKVDVEDVNTDTEEDDKEEYEKWKERELKRLFRDQAIRERERWDAEGEESHPTAEDIETERPKLKFMQRYWHKGAFFQADKDDYAAPSIDQEVYKRDFSAPTGGDKFDKLKMPKVMQVRGDKFGRSGQSKYTHLVDQDTTDRELKKQLDKKVVRSNLKRMGGMKDSFEKPSKRCR